MEKSERIKELKKTMETINKDYGAGSIMTLEEKPSTDEEVISTGSMGLDLALGVGGLPKGRVVEIFGPESSGKTTLAIHVMAECQKAGGVAAIIDAEHAFDKDYAQSLGINTEELLVSQPDYGEQALEIADKLISSGNIDVVVIDSVAALVPKGELDGEMGESKMGLHARLMSQALRKLTATIARTNTLVIFINQLRDKIGVMFGSPETTTGGNALKFYASVRLDVRRSISAQNSVNQGDVKIGNQVTVKVIKNKVAPPFRTAIFDILYGVGIDKVGEILDMGTGTGIIQKAGSWFSYNGEKIGQGRENVRQFLNDNDGFRQEIHQMILDKLND